MRDADVRDALHARVNVRYGNDPDTVVLDELGILQGAARVDVAVVNGELHGFEIKSQLDTLIRLPRQVECYGRVFDRVTLVVADNHLENALEVIPAWWEIVVAVPSGRTSAVRLTRKRAGSANRFVEARSVVELLWKEEALALLSQRNADKGCRTKPRSSIWDRLCEVYSLDEIRDAVRMQLKLRSRTAAGVGPS